jgi:hypothetical protein
MRIASTTVLLLAIGALPAAEAAKPDATKPEAAAIDLSHITVKPQGVTFSRQVSIPNGDIAQAMGWEQSCIVFQIDYDAGVEVIGVEKATLTSAVTDAGEELAPKSDADDAATATMLQASRHGLGQLWNQSSNNQAQQRSQTAQTKLTWPTKPAKTLATVAGTIALLCESKPADPIVLSPAKDFLDKPQDIPGTNGKFTLLALDPVKYRIDQSVLNADALKNVEFRDAEGARVQNLVPRSSTGDSTSYTLELTGKLPPEGEVRVLIIGQKQTVSVPFALKDVPLQAPPPQNQQPRIKALPPKGSKADAPADQPKKAPDF